jgi:glycosyltransferase involved in cell wall biosynthesis
VRKVLFVIPSLEYGGAARQLTLLAAGLPRDSLLARVCVLGAAGPWADQLRGAGVDVTVLGWDRPVDPRPLLRLRHLLAEFRPDVVHAWQRPALRAVALLRPWVRGRIVASRPLRSTDAARLGWLDRWLVRRADRVVAHNPAEAERLRRLGVPPERVAEVAPAVASVSGKSNRAEVCQTAGVPVTARLLVGVGPFERHKGFREGVWALDILKGLYPELHLLLVGLCPDRPRLEQFATALGTTGRVHFLGPRPEVTPFLTQAEGVWAPELGSGSVNAVLEALAAGKAVVASSVPALAGLVRDGETGLLVPPGDKAALARQTRRLLDDPALSRRLGDAGRRHAAEAFGPDALVRRLQSLYEGLQY